MKSVDEILEPLTREGARWMLPVTGAAFVVYVLSFFLYHRHFGEGMGFFILLPLFCVAVFYGLKGGLLLGALAHPINIAFRSLLGDAFPGDHFEPYKITAWTFALMFGVFIGAMRDAAQRSRKAQVALEVVNEKLEKTKSSLEETNRELNEALDEVKTLHGLLPICASCKRIRDGDGEWEQLEIYVREHSDAEFTHGLCPTCAVKLYGPDVL